VIGITASFWVLPQNNNLGYTVMSVSTKEEFVCVAKPSSHSRSQRQLAVYCRSRESKMEIPAYSRR
jgi:hypothetical protein